MASTEDELGSKRPVEVLLSNLILDIFGVLELIVLASRLD